MVLQHTDVSTVGGYAVMLCAQQLAVGVHVSPGAGVCPCMDLLLQGAADLRGGPVEILARDVCPLVDAQVACIWGLPGYGRADVHTHPRLLRLSNRRNPLELGWALSVQTPREDQMNPVFWQRHPTCGTLPYPVLAQAGSPLL